MAKKPTMKDYENSAKDKKMDARKGAPKEGSKADKAEDKKGLKKMKANFAAKGGKVGKC